MEKCSLNLIEFLIEVLGDGKGRKKFMKIKLDIKYNWENDGSYFIY